MLRPQAIAKWGTEEEVLAARVPVRILQRVLTAKITTQVSTIPVMVWEDLAARLVSAVGVAGPYMALGAGGEKPPVMGLNCSDHRAG